MMAFRVFKASSALKIAVEVGLVVGITPQITPRGSAIFLDPRTLVLFDDPAGHRIPVLVIDEFRGEVVLDDFIFDNPHARFGLRHDSQVNPMTVGGHSGLTEDMVHLFLAKFTVGLTRGFDPFYHPIQILSVHSATPFKIIYIDIILSYKPSVNI
jgi:hypothetical protein